MTNSNDNSDINVEALLVQLTRSQLQTQEQIRETQRQIAQTNSLVQTLTRDIESVFARNEILNEILLELRDSNETMRENFSEHQQTTNAALNSLEAINLNLLEIIRGNQN